MLRYPSISGVFWTLCLEVQFYFIYVAILALIGYDPTQPRGRAVCALSVAVIISLMWAAILPAPWPGSFLPLWHTFLLGVAAYWAWRVPLLRPYFLIFSAVVTVIAFTKGDNFPLVSATTAILLWAVTLNGSIFTALNWRWLQFLGLISYSLYLIHNPVTGATFRVGYMLTGRSLGTELLWWMVSVGFCMLAAWAMWWALERTGIKLARKISLQPRTVSFN
jgi:peptidoglycan/LPS O-acetylase OafA/YrhL